jgi:hypothetical protein
MTPEFDTTKAHSARVYDFTWAVRITSPSTRRPLPAEVNWYGGVGRKPVTA